MILMEQNVGWYNFYSKSNISIGLFYMLLDNLISIEARFEELTRLIEQNASDYQKVAEFSKERSGLEDIVSKAKQYRQIIKSIEEARQLIESDDEEMHSLAQELLSHCTWF